MVANEGTQGHVIADAVQFLPVDRNDDSEAVVGAADPRRSGDDADLAEKQTLLKRLENELKELRKAAEARPKVMTVVDRDKPADVAIHVRGSVHTLGEVVPRVSCESRPSIRRQRSRRTKAAGANWPSGWHHGPTRLPRACTPTGLALAVWPGSCARPTTSARPARRLRTRNCSIIWPADSMAEGWSMKKLIRYIVLSKTYRLSSADKRQIAERDPENRLLWRMNRRRWKPSAFATRCWSSSGQLDRTAGGGTIKPGTSADYAYQHSGTRRSVYLPVFRNSLPELLEAFDFADPSLVVGRRNTSTVATQALFLLNDPFVREQAHEAAKRLLGEPLVGDEDRLEMAFCRSLGRRPTASEREIACRTIGGARFEQGARSRLGRAVPRAVRERGLPVL